MISTPEREHARQKTIPQLTQAGYEPRVFLNTPDPNSYPYGTAINALQALQWAATRNTNVLFTEDDIDIAPDFAWHANLASNLNAITYLFLIDNPKRVRARQDPQTSARILNRQSIKRGAYTIRERQQLYGTQCVMIPQRLILTMIKLLQEPQRQPWDGRLYWWLRRTPQEPAYEMLPHPVQHRVDRTGNKPATTSMTSLSYGLPHHD